MNKDSSLAARLPFPKTPCRNLIKGVIKLLMGPQLGFLVYLLVDERVQDQPGILQSDPGQAVAAACTVSLGSSRFRFTLCSGGFHDRAPLPQYPKVSPPPPPPLLAQKIAAARSLNFHSTSVCKVSSLHPIAECLLHSYHKTHKGQPWHIS